MEYIDDAAEDDGDDGDDERVPDVMTNVDREFLAESDEEEDGGSQRDCDADERARAGTPTIAPFEESMEGGHDKEMPDASDGDGGGEMSQDGVGSPGRRPAAQQRREVIPVNSDVEVETLSEDHNSDAEYGSDGSDQEERGGGQDGRKGKDRAALDDEEGDEDGADSRSSDADELGEKRSAHGTHPGDVSYMSHVTFLKEDPEGVMADVVKEGKPWGESSPTMKQRFLESVERCCGTQIRGDGDGVRQTRKALAKRFSRHVTGMKEEYAKKAAKRKADGRAQEYAKRNPSRNAKRNAGREPRPCACTGEGCGGVLSLSRVLGCSFLKVVKGWGAAQIQARREELGDGAPSGPWTSAEVQHVFRYIVWPAYHDRMYGPDGGKFSQQIKAIEDYISVLTASNVASSMGLTATVLEMQRKASRCQVVDRLRSDSEMNQVMRWRELDAKTLYLDERQEREELLRKLMARTSATISTARMDKRKCYAHVKYRVFCEWMTMHKHAAPTQQAPCPGRRDGRKTRCEECQPPTTCRCDGNCGGYHRQGRCTLDRVAGGRGRCQRCLAWSKAHVSTFGEALRTTADDFDVDVEQHDVGKMAYPCDHCGALRFKNETKWKRLCCNGGRVKVEPLKMPPPAIKNLLESRESFEPKKNIVNYNHAFMMARQQLYADGQVYPKKFSESKADDTTSGRQCFRLGQRDDIKGQKFGFQPSFTIFGKLERKLVPLEARSQKPAGYVQVYFLAPDAATRIRMQHQPNCVKDQLDTLRDAIESVNPYVIDFKAEHARSDADPRERLVIHANRRAQEKCYRAGALSHRRNTEIAALLPDADEPGDRDFVVERADGQMKYLHDLHRSCDPLCYPLLHTHGEDGYQDTREQPVRKGALEATGLPKARGVAKKFSGSTSRAKRDGPTIREHYAFRAMVRDENTFLTCDPACSDSDGDEDPTKHYNLLHRGGMLFHQYFTDAGAKLIQERVGHISSPAFQRDKMRIDMRDNLREAFDEWMKDGGPLGLAEIRKSGRHKPLAVPGSLSGSKRDMNAEYHDAMAVVDAIGKPSLFLTMTFNQLWPEVAAAAKLCAPGGDSVQWRADLHARVFKAKLDEVVHDITKKHIFGLCVAHLYVVEFQKRGFPHAHMLVILEDNDMPLTAAQVDRISSAEIPCKEMHPELHKLVVEKMIHTCWDDGCCKDGPCEAGYPKPYSAATEVNTNGYPQYRRTAPAEGDPAVYVKTFNAPRTRIDNQNVVPYNPYLLLKYRCHFNVEVCTGVRAVKYLYKYLFKGADRAIAEKLRVRRLHHKFDEVAAFYDSRYLCTAESFWRLFAFTLRGKSHTVQRLAVHLKGEDWVTFERGEQLEALERASSSTLEAFFRYNAMLAKRWRMLWGADEEDGEKDPEDCLNEVEQWARESRYHEFPKRFALTYQAVDPSRPRGELELTWRPHKNTVKRIGRMQWVEYADNERYYLRQLLLHVPGRQACNWEDLHHYCPRPCCQHPTPLCIAFQKKRYHAARDGDERLVADLDDLLDRHEAIASEGRVTPLFGDAVHCDHAIRYPTYREVLLSRFPELLDDDRIHHASLEDGERSGLLAHQMRSMFVLIMLHGRVYDKKKLWDTHKEKLRGRRKGADETLAAVLADLDERFFSANGTRTYDHDLPAVGAEEDETRPPSEGLPDYQAAPREVRSQMCEPTQRPALAEKVEAAVRQLNDDQRRVWDHVKQRVDSHLKGASVDDNVMCIQAAGGTGKTFLNQTILRHVRAQGGVAVGTAMTGIAATLLDAGRTAHFRFMFPREANPGCMCGHQTDCVVDEGRMTDPAYRRRLYYRRARTRVLLEANVIIIDEYTMLLKEYVEALDLMLRDITGEAKPFGGKIVIFSGDWRQTLPVLPGVYDRETVRRVATNATVMDHCTLFTLSTNMRIELVRRRVAQLKAHSRDDDELRDAELHLAELEEFATFQIKTGDGELPPASGDVPPHYVELPDDICIPDGTAEDLIEWVYPDLVTHYMNTKWIAERAILAPTNVVASQINTMCNDMLPGIARTFTACNTTVEQSMGAQLAHAPSMDDLARETPSGFPPHELNLKIGSLLIVVHNLNGKVRVAYRYRH